MRSRNDDDEDAIEALLQAPVNAEAARAFVREHAEDLKRAVKALDDRRGADPGTSRINFR